MSQAVKKDAYNYDAWFDYLRLEEGAAAEEAGGGGGEKVRELYERMNLP